MSMRVSIPSAFQTQSLVLRAFEPADLPALQALLNHPELEGLRYIPWGFPDDLPLSAGQVEKILVKWSEAQKEAHLAVILRENGDLIGHAEMDWDWDPHAPSVSVVIAPAHQRQGYGSQVLRLLLAYLYENTPAHNVTLWTMRWNEAAQAFALKNGFRECGRWRHDGLYHGACVEGVVFDILRPEWAARQEQ